jgi:hypothetical protein
MTIHELAALMLAKFEEQDKKVDTTLENLAMIVARGFAEQDKKIEDFKEETTKNFKDVNKKFEEVADNFITVRRDIRNSGDRFVSFHTFDQFAHRVIALETTRSKKK